jgi:hypothetical protein
MVFPAREALTMAVGSEVDSLGRSTCLFIEQGFAERLAGADGGHRGGRFR